MVQPKRSVTIKTTTVTEKSTVSSKHAVDLVDKVNGPATVVFGPIAVLHEHLPKKCAITSMMTAMAVSMMDSNAIAATNVVQVKSFAKLVNGKAAMPQLPKQKFAMEKMTIAMVALMRM